MAVASALLMEFIDSTALSTALPTLARAFSVDPIHLKLALTSYILALAVFTPASGWAAERFGARRVFMTAMVVFLVGSALCGLSRNLEALVASRILQGAGGAMMTPVARLIVVGSTPKERLIRAMGWFTMPALVGPLVGPPLAGLVLSVADWPWIFYLNLPIGLLGMTAVMRFVPKGQPTDMGRFDTLGFLLSAVAISGLVVVAETAGLSLLPPWAQMGVLTLALASGWLYLRKARTTPKPILDLGLLKYRTFRASLLGGVFVRLGIGASPFLLPLLLQVALGWSPLKASMVTLGTGVGVLIARPFAAASLKRFGFRTSLAVFVTLTALLTAAPGFFTHGTPMLLMAGALFFGGFARSNQFIAANTIAYADVPQDKVAAASTLSAVAQQVGLALGVSFGGLMLHLARGGGAALTPDRFTWPFVAIGVVTLLALPVYLRLDRDAGAEISGRVRSPIPSPLAGEGGPRSGSGEGSKTLPAATDS
ncbi:DHA2 family efflux MFS transporter permease subunit [Caulobacter sp. AP07]|uniref:DHA2 family efflux MFS transporter permease subunit n=1 Tax=Caulobacter sp. AP07 TaxID=1144304 RepID=UPI0003171C70|nr:DHA2 family efflux MFS transporter permease subunit [Caulobacter sp. AP07]